MCGALAGSKATVYLQILTRFDAVRPYCGSADHLRIQAGTLKGKPKPWHRTETGTDVQILCANPVHSMQVSFVIAGFTERIDWFELS
jgi:hypothetical protein